MEAMICEGFFSDTSLTPAPNEREPGPSSQGSRKHASCRDKGTKSRKRRGAPSVRVALDSPVPDVPHVLDALPTARRSGREKKVRQTYSPDIIPPKPRAKPSRPADTARATITNQGVHEKLSHRPPINTAPSQEIALIRKSRKKRKRKPSVKLQRREDASEYKVSLLPLVVAAAEGKAVVIKSKRKRKSSVKLEYQEKIEGQGSLVPLPGNKPVGFVAASASKRKPKRPRASASSELTPVDHLPLPQSKVLCPIAGSSAQPPKSQIRSSRFATALRIVAGLPSPKRIKIEKREPPARRAPVWAESRQELCEALPYYRAFQAGLYSCSRVAFGYLLEAFPAPRDIWAADGRIIISHGGGQCIRTTDKNGKQGEPALAADQTASDSRVDTLLQAYYNRTPLILITGEGYPSLPWKLGCAYAVLGWYWISAVWVEGEPVARGIKPPPGRDYFCRYKVRFDWVDSQGMPWWQQAACGTLLSIQQVAEEVTPPACDIGDSAPSPLACPVTPSLGGRTPQCSHFDNTFEPPARSSFSLGKVSQAVQLHGLLTPPITPSENSALTLDAPMLNPGLLERPQATAEDDNDNDNDNRDLGDDMKHGKESDAEGNVFDESELDENEVQGNEDDDDSDDRDDDDSEHDENDINDSHDLDRRNEVKRYDYPLPASRPLSRPQPVCTITPNQPIFQHLSQRCPSCVNPSPRLYAEGWICLHPSCKQFWLLETNLGLMPLPPGFSLSYTKAWLQPTETPPELSMLPYDIVPPQPAGDISEVAACPGDRTLWKGWVCDVCGRANCRYRWEIWECAHCGKQVAPLDSSCIISAPERRSFLGDPVVNPMARIKSSIRRLPEACYTVVTYELPRKTGKLIHLIPDDQGVADGIWESYQRSAAGTEVPLFERRPLKSKGLKGQLLAQHFAINSGANYKYNVDSASLTFDESPKCVRMARNLLCNVVSQAIEEEVEFNEVLSVMYREGQKMSWHDDGEEGLGPVVGSLSLGSSATISWRPKFCRDYPNSNYHLGASASSGSKKASPPIALSLTLSHGDIVIMHGEAIQLRYSHRVIPHGFRVAATARNISS